ncbi:MAG TPA: putative toxin-antitoxin system toxin component, PIN family [Flavobacteriaceae bacterium]|nr:putative toxin-antitoxin system toxin component, PIN family [Flavobacteriaceae bacterium]
MNMVTSNLKLCRDGKDDFLLNLSLDGEVDYLVTGDKDLLVLEKIGKTEILTYREFLKKIQPRYNKEKDD